MLTTQTLRALLRGFGPSLGRVEPAEAGRSALGALGGLLLAGVLSRLCVPDPASALLLIAPMGASAVLLFAVPASPLAQPWSILGGNLVAAVIGVACQRWCPWPWLAPALAGSLAIAAMLELRCLHPPSGAVALTAVLGGPTIRALGFGYVLVPVLLNTLLLLAWAICFNPRVGRRYPHGAGVQARIPDSETAAPTARSGLTAQDIDEVLRNRHEILDVSREDLTRIVQEAEIVAYQRRFGSLNCRAVMDATVPAVQFGTPLQEAWKLLRSGPYPALVAVDRARRVAGTLSLADFVEHANAERFAEVGPGLGKLIRRAIHSHNPQPEVVGQIMNRRFWQVQASQPVIELAPLLREKGLAFLPVVDEERRLVGLLSMVAVVNALLSISTGGGPSQVPVDRASQTPG